MSFQRLAQRVEYLKLVTTGFLKEHQLKFHKKSHDGSGKADAFFTGGAHDQVWGVVYEIDQRSKTLLDHHEELGHSYEDRFVDIQTTNEILKEVQVYCALSARIEQELQPYHWYKALVVHGAREHGLPNHYVEMLSTIPHWEDPDIERTENHFKIINHNSSRTNHKK